MSVLEEYIKDYKADENDKMYEDKMKALHDYARNTGFWFKDEAIKDNKSLDNISEEKYVESLTGQAMLDDSVFEKFSNSQDWNHIRAVMNKADEKCKNRNKKDDVERINRKNARKAKILDLMKELLDDEDEE